ncbi:MAG: O-antigen ligase family protein [Desulfofustis sp.]|nr:O-antigen ligase family protein [Desulfofustis sp.]
MSPVTTEHTIKRLQRGGTASLCLACFFTPLSTSLLGLFSILAVAAWIISGGLLDLPRQFRANPSSLIALLLFCLMAGALTYSPVDPAEGFATLRKYRELLLMPVVFSLLSMGSVQRQRAQLSFLAGCIVLMTISYLGYFELFDTGRYGYSIVYHITHSFFMAVLGFWAIHKASSKSYQSWQKYVWLVVSGAAVINLFYIAPGRTGMFVFCCLALLYLYQRLSLIKWFVAIVLFLALLFGAYQTSPNFSDRVDEAINEIADYESGKSRTSIGQRFDWWKVSLQLVGEKPLLGHGAGSFETAHNQKIIGSRITPTDNPHNEYLFITTQFGLVGLLLFLLMIALQLQEAKGIGVRDRQLLHGVLLALLAGSLMNSLLFDSQQGHFYLFMSGALLATGD